MKGRNRCWLNPDRLCDIDCVAFITPKEGTMKDEHAATVDGTPVDVSNKCAIALGLWRLAEAARDIELK